MGRDERAVAIVAWFGSRLGSCDDALTVIGIWPKHLLSYAKSRLGPQEASMIGYRRFITAFFSKTISSTARSSSMNGVGGQSVPRKAGCSLAEGCQHKPRVDDDRSARDARTVNAPGPHRQLPPWSDRSPMLSRSASSSRALRESRPRPGGGRNGAGPERWRTAHRAGTGHLLARSTCRKWSWPASRNRTSTRFGLRDWGSRRNGTETYGLRVPIERFRPEPVWVI